MGSASRPRASAAGPRGGHVAIRWIARSGAVRDIAYAELLTQVGEEDLANVIFQFGEERQSRRIARAIVTEPSMPPYTQSRR